MNKTQLVDVVAAKAELKKKEAEAAVSAVVAAITEALEAGEKVLISCENGELKIIKAKPRCKLCGADMSEDDQFVICLRCIDDIRSTK